MKNQKPKINLDDLFLFPEDKKTLHIKELHQHIQELYEEIDRLFSEINKANEQYEKDCQTIESLKETNAKQVSQILALKSQLYDLLR